MRTTRTTRTTAASVGAIALVTSGLAAAPAANAFVVTGPNSFTVSAAELQAAFGAGVNLASVTFTVDGGDSIYLVSCEKTPGKSGKTIKHDFRRHSSTSWSVMATPVTTNSVITSYTLVATKTGEVMTKVACPKPFSKKATSGPVGMTDFDVFANYLGSTVELSDS